MTTPEHQSQRARVAGSLDAVHHPDVYARRRRPVSIEVHMPDGLSPHDIAKTAAQLAHAAELLVGPVEVSINGV
jgi:hypothetical protein